MQEPCQLLGTRHLLRLWCNKYQQTNHLRGCIYSVRILRFWFKHWHWFKRSRLIFYKQHLQRRAIYEIRLLLGHDGRCITVCRCRCCRSCIINGACGHHYPGVFGIGMLCLRLMTVLNDAILRELANIGYCLLCKKIPPCLNLVLLV